MMGARARSSARRRCSLRCCRGVALRPPAWHPQLFVRLRLPAELRCATDAMLRTLRLKSMPRFAPGKSLAGAPSSYEDALLLPIFVGRGLFELGVRRALVVALTWPSGGGAMGPLVWPKTLYCAPLSFLVMSGEAGPIRLVPARGPTCRPPRVALSGGTPNLELEVAEGSAWCRAEGEPRGAGSVVQLGINASGPVRSVPVWELMVGRRRLCLGVRRQWLDVPPTA